MKMSEMAQSMVNRLGYPYQIFTAGTDYTKLMSAYEESKKRGRTEGFTPLLVPVDSVLDEYFGILEDDGYSLQDILKKNVDAAAGKEFLDQRFAEYRQDMGEDFDITLEDFIGEYTDEPECIDQFSSFLNYRTNTVEETILLEVPTENPWELVAYVPFGGWNDCPDVEEMLSVCKYWYEKYGAVPVVISHDVLEMSVPSPVAEEDALELAKEHYAFTPDRVDQMTRTGTLAEVIACLKASKIWFFWWD